MGTNFDHECTSPGDCPLHKWAAAKVRAVKVDDALYVNMEDLILLMSAARETEITISADLALSAHPELTEDQLASMFGSIEMGMGMHEKRLALMLGLPILDVAEKGFGESPFVSPEALKTEDTIPDDWAEDRK